MTSRPRSPRPITAEEMLSALVLLDLPLHPAEHNDTLVTFTIADDGPGQVHGTAIVDPRGDALGLHQVTTSSSSLPSMKPAVP